jgi:hypothetical protein
MTDNQNLKLADIIEIFTDNDSMKENIAVVCAKYVYATVFCDNILGFKLPTMNGFNDKNLTIEFNYENTDNFSLFIEYLKMTDVEDKFEEYNSLLEQEQEEEDKDEDEDEDEEDEDEEDKEDKENELKKTVLTNFLLNFYDREYKNGKITLKNMKKTNYLNKTEKKTGNADNIQEQIRSTLNSEEQFASLNKITLTGPFKNMVSNFTIIYTENKQTAVSECEKNDSVFLLTEIGDFRHELYAGFLETMIKNCNKMKIYLINNEYDNADNDNVFNIFVQKIFIGEYSKNSNLKILNITTNPNVINSFFKGLTVEQQNHINETINKLKPKILSINNWINDNSQNKSPNQEDYLEKKDFMVIYIDKESLQLYPLNDNCFKKKNKNKNFKFQNNNIVHLNLQEKNDNTYDIVYQKKITKIEITQSYKEPVGYAELFGFTNGIWLEITFNDMNPSPVKIAKIIEHNKENDYIKFLLTKDSEKLELDEENQYFMNFAFKGIPKNLNISLKILNYEPTILNKEETGKPEDKIEDELDETEKEEKVNEDEEIDEGIEITIEQNIEILEEFYVDETEMLYPLREQLNDFLNQLLMQNSLTNNTSAYKLNAKIMVERFRQLRQFSSKFNERLQVVDIFKVVENPLALYLSSLKNNLYWIMYTGLAFRKLYEVDADNKLQDYVAISVPWNSYLTRSKENMSNTTNVLELNKFMRPFENMVIKNEDVDEMLHKSVFVPRDLNVLLNNFNNDELGNFLSSFKQGDGYAKAKPTISRPLVMQRYITEPPQYRKLDTRGKTDITKLNYLRNLNDSLNLNGVITFPSPFIAFSQIQMFSSNILTKTNLNCRFLNFWEILTKQTTFFDIRMTSDKKNVEYTENMPFLDKKSFKYYTYEKKKDAKDLYQIFMKMFPNTTNILDQIDLTFFTYNFSLVSLIQRLSPFLIDTIHLKMQHFNKINEIINKTIEIQTTEILNSKKLINSVKTQNSSLNNTFIDDLFTKLGKENNIIIKTINKLYQINDELANKLSNSEKMNLILSADYGMYFMSELAKVLDSDTDNTTNEVTKEIISKHCSHFVIAKKYYTEESLLLDNNNENIIFDKEFDDSLNGNKKVENGHHAILVNSTNHEDNKNIYVFYLRKDNTWEKITEPTNFSLQNDLNCNIEKECIYDQKEKCIVSNTSKEKIMEQVFKDIINEYDQTYNFRINAIKQIRERNSRFLQNNLVKMIQIRNLQNWKHDVNKYYFGKDFSSNEDKNIKNLHSPYEKYKDAVLSIENLNTKYDAIIKFAQNLGLTLEDNSDDDFDKDWLICMKTKKPFFPKIWLQLALSYHNHNLYINCLNKLQKSEGYYVDKQTGEKIIPVSLSFDTEFDENGNQVVITEVFENDSENVQTSSNNNLNNITNEEKIILDIVNGMIETMGILLSPQNIQELTQNVVTTYKQNYNKILEKFYKQKEDNKKTKLIQIQNIYLFVYTLAFFIIFVVSNIPSVRITKSSNLTPKLYGFPLNEEDTTFETIGYFLDVAKLKEGGIWAIAKINSLKNELIDTITYLVRKNHTTQSILNQKKKYLNVANQEKPKISLWKQFLPPLNSIGEITINSLESQEEEKEEKLISKIIKFSMKIYYEIESEVNKKTVILMDNKNNANACCNEKSINNLSFETVFEYFNTKTSIAVTNETVRRLSKKLNSKRMEVTKLRSTVNKKKDLTLDDTLDVSDDTKILMLMKVCKFFSSAPVPDLHHILPFSINKPLNINRTDSLQEKIKKTKKVLGDYKLNNDQFKQLFKYSSKNNVINMNFVSQVVSQEEIEIVNYEDKNEEEINESVFEEEYDQKGGKTEKQKEEDDDEEIESPMYFENNSYYYSGGGDEEDEEDEEEVKVNEIQENEEQTKKIKNKENRVMKNIKNFNSFTCLDGIIHLMNKDINKKSRSKSKSKSNLSTIIIQLKNLFENYKNNPKNITSDNLKAIIGSIQDQNKSLIKNLNNSSGFKDIDKLQNLFFNWEFIDNNEITQTSNHKNENNQTIGKKMVISIIDTKQHENKKEELKEDLDDGEFMNCIEFLKNAISFYGVILVKKHKEKEDDGGIVGLKYYSNKHRKFGKTHEKKLEEMFNTFYGNDTQKKGILEQPLDKEKISKLLEKNKLINSLSQSTPLFLNMLFLKELFTFYLVHIFSNILNASINNKEFVLECLKHMTENKKNINISKKLLTNLMFKDTEKERAAYLQQNQSKEERFQNQIISKARGNEVLNANDYDEIRMIRENTLRKNAGITVNVNDEENDYGNMFIGE